jgi:hypothetical protein
MGGPGGAVFSKRVPPGQLKLTNWFFSTILDNEVKKMKLPNAERAFVDIEKLRGYCLNPYHIRGKNKARIFSSILG